MPVRTFVWITRIFMNPKFLVLLLTIYEQLRPGHFCIACFP